MGIDLLNKKTVKFLYIHFSSGNRQLKHKEEDVSCSNGHWINFFTSSKARAKPSLAPKNL